MKDHSLMDKKMESMLSTSLITEPDMRAHTSMDIVRAMEQSSTMKVQ